VITSAKIIFSPVTVCLSVNRITKKINDQTVMNFFGMVRHNPEINRLDFGGNLDLETHTGIFERILQLRYWQS